MQKNIHINSITQTILGTTNSTEVRLGGCYKINIYPEQEVEFIEIKLAEFNKHNQVSLASLFIDSERANDLKSYLKEQIKILRETVHYSDDISENQSRKAIRGNKIAMYHRALDLMYGTEFHGDYCHASGALLRDFAEEIFLEFYDSKELIEKIFQDDLTDIKTELSEGNSDYLRELICESSKRLNEFSYAELLHEWNNRSASSY